MSEDYREGRKTNKEWQRCLSKLEMVDEAEPFLWTEFMLIVCEGKKRMMLQVIFTGLGMITMISFQEQFYQSRRGNH
ncbi:MAG: hypothetical protein Q7J76_05485 [Candidatus Brocadiaceae bacterium]|nr:hypothetical protein [Candidatus Brocadiaceae bacterium]